MALLPPFFLDTVVALGIGSDETKRQWIGSGFVFGNLISTDPPPKQYGLWLITNKHVLEGLKEIYVKFNSAAEPNSKDYRLLLVARNGRPRWVGHPAEKVDVAAIILNTGFLAEENRRFTFFQSDDHVMTKQQMKQTSITEGDRVFVLGFPMGLVSAERQYVICRGGYVARIRDYIEDRATDFLVDATVFPGNSGGPVILCPSAIAISGTNPIQKADLIGIVKAYVPYVDMAISQQTNRPRITFEENSGLTAIDPVDAIIETIELAKKRLEGRTAQVKYRTRKTRKAEEDGNPNELSNQARMKSSDCAP